MKNFFIVLLVILIVAGTGYGVYYQIDNYNKKYETNDDVNNNAVTDNNMITDNNEQDIQEEVGENIDVNSDIVVNLMNKFTILNDVLLVKNYEGYFYQKDVYKETDIDNSVKVLLASANVINNVGTSYENAETNLMKSVSADEINKEIVNIFGPNVTFENTGVNLGKTLNISYDSSSNKYLFYSVGLGGTAYSHYETKIEDAIKYDDKLEIIEKVAYVEISNNIQNIYKYKSDNEIIGTLNDGEDIFTKYGDKLNSYKYTFAYDNGNYYLSSVELVK